MTYSIESPSFDVLKLVEVEDGYWNITNKQSIDYDSMDQAVIQFTLVATELLRQNVKKYWFETKLRSCVSGSDLFPINIYIVLPPVLVRPARSVSTG